jgi:hypothetical protein
MFDYIGKYQATFFAPVSEIAPSPEVISALLLMFRDKGFLPSTFQELSAESAALNVRLRLNSPNNEWGINFAHNRIDIEKNPIAASGKNMGDVKKFAEDAQDFFSRILGHFKKKGTRLSIVTGGLLKEMTDEQLTAVYGKLFRPLPFYDANIPFEWVSRCVGKFTTKIDKAPEKINVITELSRVAGQFIEPSSVRRFDRINLHFDINTVAESVDNRFTADSFGAFFKGALKIRANIIEQVRGVVNA